MSDEVRDVREVTKLVGRVHLKPIASHLSNSYCHLFCTYFTMQQNPNNPLDSIITIRYESGH